MFIRYISGHRYKRKHTAAKCKVLMIYRKSFIGIFKNKYDCQTRHICKDHRCEGADMAYKYKIFLAAI